MLCVHGLFRFYRRLNNLYVEGFKNELITEMIDMLSDLLLISNFLNDFAYFWKISYLKEFKQILIIQFMYV